LHQILCYGIPFHKTFSTFPTPYNGNTHVYLSPLNNHLKLITIIIKIIMLDEIDIFKNYLHQFNLRWTPQRKLVLDVFLQQSEHVHIDDIHVRVREKDPTIGIATLYRNVKLCWFSGVPHL
jgi:hypothetical protein